MHFLKHFKENKEFYYFVLIVIVALNFFNLYRYEYVTYKGCIFRIDKVKNDIKINYENFPEMIQDYIKERREINKQVDDVVKNID